MSKTPVGEVRPSQLLWTYGPGALIDLPNLSVVTMGIDRWELGRCQPIQEARLLTRLAAALVPGFDRHGAPSGTGSPSGKAPCCVKPAARARCRPPPRRG